MSIRAESSSTARCLIGVLIVALACYALHYYSWHPFRNGDRFSSGGGYDVTNDRSTTTTTITADHGELIGLEGSRFVFLGDSTMKALSLMLVTLLNCSKEPDPIDARPGMERCSNHLYYGIESGPFTPIEKGMGPMDTGKHYRGCTDCSGCVPAQHVCNKSAHGFDFNFEYLPVEFANDKEAETRNFKYTQEVALSYLKRQAKPTTAIIFNTGLHDLQYIPPSFSSSWSKRQNEDVFYESYRENLLWYTKLLLEAFRPRANATNYNKQEQPWILWLSTSKVKESIVPSDYTRITTNHRIKALNKIAEKIMKAHGIPVIDTYFLSALPGCYQLHTDAVHMFDDNHFFYRLLAAQVLAFIAKLRNGD